MPAPTGVANDSNQGPKVWMFDGPSPRQIKEKTGAKSVRCTTWHNSGWTVFFDDDLK